MIPFSGKVKSTSSSTKDGVPWQHGDLAISTDSNRHYIREHNDRGVYIDWRFSSGIEDLINALNIKCYSDEAAFMIEDRIPVGTNLLTYRYNPDFRVSPRPLEPINTNLLGIF